MSTQRFHISCLIVAVALFSTACPLPEIPKPAPAGPVTVPMPENSTIQIAVKANMEALRARIDQMVPSTIVEDDGHDCTEYGVYKRQPVGLSASGKVLNTRIGIVYRIKLYGLNHKPVCLGKVSCGYDEPSRRADVNSAVELKWNPNWYLTSSTSTDINMLDSCDLSFLNIDARQMIREKLQPKLGQISATVDQQVPQLTNMRGKAEMGWMRLQQPLQLGPNVWLLVNPITPHASALNGAGTTMSLSVGLDARPQIFIQAQAPSPTQLPLPPLQLSAATNRFHIALDGHLSYESATRAAIAGLVGQEFRYGRYRVKITSARVYGSVDRKLVLELGIGGTVKGKIYFEGTPTYVSDAQGERIIVPDLDYTLATRNVLARVADWLGHCNFVEAIRPRAVYPLDDRIETLRTQLQNGLNQNLGGNITLRGRVDAVRIGGLYVDSTFLVVRGIADGTAEAEIR